MLLALSVPADNVLTRGKMCLRRSLISFTCMRPSVIIQCFVSVSFHWDLSGTVTK